MNWLVRKIGIEKCLKANATSNSKIEAIENILFGEPKGQ